MIGNSLRAIVFFLFFVSFGNVFSRDIFPVNKAIEIYTASYCSECKRAKAYMQAHKIAFTEYDVEQDRNRLREFYQRGGKGIPLLFIGGEMMHGFEQERFEELLAEPKNVPTKEASLVTRTAPTVDPIAAGPGANRQAQE